MKKLLLSMATMLLAMSVSAQGLFAPKTDLRAERVSQALASVAKAPAKVATLENNQRIIGPYTSDTYETNGLGLISYPDTYPVACYMEEGFQDYSGAKLTKIRFALAQATKVNRVFMYAFTSDGAMSLVAEQEMKSSAKAGWNEVSLANPVTLDFSNVAAILLGFEYVQTTSNTSGYPLSLVIEDMICPTYIYGNLGSSGLAWYDLGTEDYGSLSVQAVVESDEFPEHAIKPVDFGSHNLVAGASNDVTVKFVNLGTGVQNFDYTVAFDGVAGEEQHINLAKPLNSVGGSFTQKVTLVAPEALGEHDVVLTVTKVNGVDNQATDKDAVGKVLTLSKALPRGLVVEEFTGTGCGWCPRGLVGMGKMREAYGNNFIGIGIHQYNASDAMYNSEYANLGFSGAPSCTVNRKGIVDPYYGSGDDILDDAAAEMAVLPEIGVTVTGKWNDDKTEVEATATIEPLVSGNYEIAYVLIADKLQGTTNAWKQNNYYSKSYASQTGMTKNQLPDDLKFLWDLGSTYSPEFDDVMIGSSYIGTKNDAKLGAVTGGEIVTQSYTVYMPMKASLYNAIDPDKVAVCALIINAETGAIANAAKFYLSETEGIAEQHADRRNLTETARYNAAGQQIFAPQKGLNIVQLSDGSVQKIMVK